jgi:hypothetical protein
MWLCFLRNCALQPPRSSCAVRGFEVAHLEAPVVLVASLTENGSGSPACGDGFVKPAHFLPGDARVVQCLRFTVVVVIDVTVEQISEILILSDWR